MLKSKLHFEQKGGTKTVSFRIPDHVVAELKSDAARLNVSPSTMLNNVLRRWLDWDRYAEKLDLIPVPKKLLSEIVLGSDAGQIHGLASKALLSFKGVDLTHAGNSANSVMRSAYSYAHWENLHTDDEQLLRSLYD